MRRNVFRVALMCMFSLLIVAPGVLSATKTLKVCKDILNVHRCLKLLLRTI